MIHRPIIDRECVIVCGDKFLKEFDELFKKELNKNKYDK